MKKKHPHTSAKAMYKFFSSHVRNKNVAPEAYVYLALYFTEFWPYLLVSDLFFAAETSARYRCVDLEAMPLKKRLFFLKKMRQRNQLDEIPF